MQMWGLGVPILYCFLFRVGLGLGLLFAQEFSAFFGGGGGGGGGGGFVPPVLAVSGTGAGAGGLPGLERIGWGNWMDLVGDWCGGVGLMIGEFLVLFACV